LLRNLEAQDFLNGQVLLIDKPLEWTSFDAVNKLRYAIKKRFKLKKIKVGHAGTLDPLATGLLIICTGKETKNINSYMGQEKEYTGSITLGATTPSYDLETEIDARFPTAHITPDLLHKTAKTFEGTIDQLPPVFSAIKKDGKKAYDLARAGEQVDMKARQVHIEQFNITGFDNNLVHFKVRCSKGTYIRSLAYDFGKALESGAHLSSLRRTAIGTFQVENAINPETFVKALFQDQELP
jgi:tRNA pseudouridine55 synthase